MPITMLAEDADTKQPPAGPQPPEDAYAEWQPSDAEKWDVRRCGHLLRRASFGASHETLHQAREAGMAASVDKLFDFDPASDVGGLNAFLDQARGLYDIRRGPHLVAEWWYHRMTHTPAPLQERVALFWHDHFATSAGKVGRADWMHDQIELFRTGGLGSFRDLLVAVGRQPAMLRWLDGNNSHKKDPNENYAREILELFALGVGHYEEKDIQELARAFTGWQIRNREGHHNPDRYDDGEKTVFGQTGTFNDEQAVDVILAHEQAPRFIAGRLLETFVHREPTDDQVGHYAGRLRHHGWQIGPVLKEMLKSRLFYSEWAYRSRIKSPVELAVGACFALGSTPRADFLRKSCERMGQMLLYPPNVAGWKGGENWINATTVMVRFEFCRDLAQGGFNEFVESGTQQQAFGRKLDTADKVVNAFAEVLLDGEIDGATRGRMLDYLTRGTDNRPAEFKLDGRGVNDKVRGMVQLLASAPQYQLA